MQVGCLQRNLIKKAKKKHWAISEIVGMEIRSFNLMECAVELFTMEGNTYFFNLYDSKIAKDLILKIKSLKKNEEKDRFFINRQEAFKQSGLTGKWVRGEITNFEYLMKINSYAGRTYNDINQYPVFPWILKDYDCTELDLTDESKFRKLNTPIGALNPSRFEYLIERFKTLVDDDKNPLMKPFMFGTHYSGVGPVLHYMIRLEPFTSLNTQLQSGRFDCPDRLFQSIKHTWESCMTQSDFKELLPEFFYLPDFLINKYK